MRRFNIADSLLLTSIAVAAAGLWLAGCGCSAPIGGRGFDMTGLGGRDSGEEYPDFDGGTEENCGLNSCATQGATCGLVGDGCGAAIQCGTCTAPQTCGGGGGRFQCGGSAACVPRSCQGLGVGCGPQGDGCGGVLQCGTCTAPATCGGGGVVNTCGGGSGGGVPCTNLCLQQMNCGGGVTTTVTGKVVAATDPSRFGQPDPIYNALVYVPNGTVQPFTAKVACDQCDAEASGSPLVTAYSNVDGTFELTNVPCGTNIPLVVQLGRWRRQIVIPNVTCCAPNALTTAQTRLPRNRTEGDIPKIALVTAKVDGLECVLRKMGIDDAEFTEPSGAGRVHLFKDNGATLSASTPDQSTLWGSAATLSNYDMVLFPCGGRQLLQARADQQRLIDYADQGGRIFATHYSFAWLIDAENTSAACIPTQYPTLCTAGLPLNNPAEPQPFAQTANWRVNQFQNDAYVDGIIDTTFPKGIALSQWLSGIGASTIAGQIKVRVVRRNLDDVNAPSQRWMSSVTPPVPTLHYTFNTPVGKPPAQQCGRVVYSDFHVENITNGYLYTFPAECGADAPLTAQEKLLEFMLFDLGSCITPDVPPPPPTCTPLTCVGQGTECGPMGDGCGQLVDCGTCPPPDTCGGGGVYGKCGHPPCSRLGCADYGAECGLVGDGCGQVVDCGDCVWPETCGGGGVANQCGSGWIK